MHLYRAQKRNRESPTEDSVIAHNSHNKMSVQGPLTLIIDPSDKFRPEKSEELFRNYTQENCEWYDRVQSTYYQMHTYQTYDFAKAKLAQWGRFDHAEMNILDALDTLNNLVDESDPDVDIPNSVHAFQTAERIREVHPDKDWFHLTGLIHDLGKIMAMWGEPQWSVVGDTFPLGCAPSDEIVFGRKSFVSNPDFTHPIYGTKLGTYKESCGLRNVVMSWGHDEYMYRVLMHNKSTLPDEALYMIRFHSFYPWHTAKQYNYLCDDHDLNMLPSVLEFNKFDLYSKADEHPDMDALKSYYQSLIDKYCPGLLKW